MKMCVLPGLCRFVCSAETASPLSTSHNDYLPRATVHTPNNFKRIILNHSGRLVSLQKAALVHSKATGEDVKTKIRTWHFKSMPSERQDSVGRLALHEDEISIHEFFV